MEVSSQDMSPTMRNGLEIYEVPTGWPGTAATLQLMRREIRAGQFSPSLHRLVDGWVRSLGRNPTAEIARIYQRARKFITWRKGPVGMLQFLRGPEKIIQRRAGNCADLAVFLSSAFQYLGHPTRLITTAPRGRGADKMNHVWVQVWDRARKVWIAADPTFSRRLGAQIPRTRRGTTFKGRTMQVDGLMGLDQAEAQKVLEVGEKFIESTPYGELYSLAKTVFGATKIKRIKRTRTTTPDDLAKSLVEFGKYQRDEISLAVFRGKLRESGWGRLPSRKHGKAGMVSSAGRSLQKATADMQKADPGALDTAMAKATGKMMIAEGIVENAAGAPAAAVAAVKQAAARVGLPFWALPAAGIAAAGIVGALVLKKRRKRR